MTTKSPRFETALTSSRVLTTIHTIITTSLVYTLLHRRTTRARSLDSEWVSSALTTATTYTSYQSLTDSFTRAYVSASTPTAGATILHWTKTSYLYRWLTKEPEPDVIVIDLRDTLSVGPIIALLDQLVSLLIPASHRSSLVTHTHRLTSTFNTTPVRYTSLILLIAIITNTLFATIAGSTTHLGVIVRLILTVVFLAGTRVRLSWPEVIDTRPVQLLITVFEPPEPPDWDEPPNNRP